MGVDRFGDLDQTITATEIFDDVSGASVFQRIVGRDAKGVGVVRLGCALDFTTAPDCTTAPWAADQLGRATNWPANAGRLTHRTRGRRTQHARGRLTHRAIGRPTRSAACRTDASSCSPIILNLPSHVFMSSPISLDPVAVSLTSIDAFDLTEPADAFVFGFRGEDLSTQAAATVDAATGGMLSRMIGSGDISTEAGSVTRIPAPSDVGVAVFVAVALGSTTADQPVHDLGGGERHAVADAAAAAVRHLADRARETIVISMQDVIDTEHIDALCIGAITGCERESIGKTSTKRGHYAPEAIRVVGASQSAINRAKAIGGGINRTRRLVNAPANEIYPESFAAVAASIAEATTLTIEVWDEERLASENCRAMLAVGRASVKPPRLVMLRHNGGGDEPPIAIVGKGVTFDSGGLSLKPSDSMIDMKCDMAGAATVVGVMQALAELNVPRNVIGVCGLAENMISGDAYRLGDVIETRSGKTIEIHNTDAEGRVVLADTLDVVADLQPESIVDLATLTGACMVALGVDIVGSMSNNPDVQSAVAAAADAEGEYVWPLPMHKIFDDKIKSKVADIKNIGNGRWGGAITAGKFLEQFVRDTPWCHLDIAGPAFAESDTPARDAGATGVMVRTLVRWIENQARR